MISLISPVSVWVELIGEVRFPMQPGSSYSRRTKTSAWTLVFGATIAALICMSAVWTPRAAGQDNGGLSSQTPSPVMITPAPSNPSANTPLEPIFPQSTPSNASGVNGAARSSRDVVPLGPSLGAGLGYGPIRPGDIVEVQVFDAPEYAVRMPVSPAGQIAIPYAGLFHIEGMTSIEAASAIARLFVQEQILRDPRVIVTTQQFGYSVTVMGEVRNPGIYPLAGKNFVGSHPARK
jgi:hypothetical protein